MLLIAACSGNNEDIKQNNEKTEHVGETPNFTGKVIVDEKEYDMIPGGFEWDSPGKSVNTDAASPTLIAEDFDPIIVAAHDEIKLEIEKNPDIILKLWEEDADSKVDAFENNRFTAPEEAGEYIYEAFARWTNSDELDGWTQGSISYTFVIEVK